MGVVTPHTPCLAYDGPVGVGVRETLFTGCAVLWKDNSPLSRAIRMWSEFSHASLVVRMFDEGDGRDRVYLIEALAGGLKPRHISTRLAEYAGQAYVFRPVLSRRQQNAIRLFAMDKAAEGVRYDYGGLFANIFGRISMDARRYICSEFVWAAWLHANAVANIGKAPRPGDIVPWAKKHKLRGDLVQVETGWRR